MGKMKELKQDVMEYLVQLRADKQYDRFRASDDVRKRFNLSRHQTAQLIQEFNEKY